MTDMRFPERWLNDRRILRLSDAAFRLFVAGMAWSVANRTDGELLDDDLDLVPNVDPTRAVELEKAGLWRKVRGTWLVIDYDATQISRDELEVLDNARRREREKKARQRKSRGTSESLSPGIVPRDFSGDRTGQDRTGQDRTLRRNKSTTGEWPKHCALCGKPSGGHDICHDCEDEHDQRGEPE